MKARIDFSLSSRFDVVEQTIFRLVLDGVTDARIICALLPLYSDNVLANAIKKLVNYQILRADVGERSLSVSEIVLNIIEECLRCSEELMFPEELTDSVDGNKIFITDYEMKGEILKAILPKTSAGFLINSLDFVLYRAGDRHE